MVIFTLKKILASLTELFLSFTRAFDSLDLVRRQVPVITVILGLCRYLGIDNRVIVR